MLKQLILLRIKGMFVHQVKSSKNKKATLGKIILISILFAYLAVTILGMFGLLFYTLVEPFVLMGIEWLYFAIMGLMVIIFCFIGSVFMTQNIIYNANDNDLLLSLPIAPKDILLSRVFTILIFNYIYEILIALPAFVVYIVFAGMSIFQIVMFVLVLLTLPLFVVALSCLAGWGLTQILVRVKNRNIISIVFYVVFFVAYFFFIGGIEEKMVALIQNGKTIAQVIEKTLFPIYHMAVSITDTNGVSLVIYLLCALIPAWIVMDILSKNFIKLAIHKPKIEKKKYVQKELKDTSLIVSLMFREWKHLISDAMVFMNGASGSVFTLVGIIGIIFYKNQILETMNLLVLDGLLVMPMLCMMAMAMCMMNIWIGASISLEGNRLWILKSLPLSSLDILHSKLMFHMTLSGLPSLLFSIVLSSVFEVSLIDAIFIVVIPILFNLFMGIGGMLMNLWKPKFDWLNEVICVKQSFSTGMTMFGAMGSTVLMAGVFIYLNKYLSAYSIACIYVVVFVAVNITLYRLLVTKGVKRFEEL